MKRKKERENAPPSLQLTFDELTSRTCHWPYGEARNFHFCGHPKTLKKPYCQHHLSVAYRPVSDSLETLADMV